MTERTEFLAWALLLSAFGVFLLLAGGIVVLGRWYWENASDPQSARATVIQGSVLVQHRGQGGWELVTRATPLQEGDGVRTVEGSRALVTLFDGSQLELLPKTEITLTDLRSRRWNGPSYRLTVQQRSGKAHYGVSPKGDHAKTFLVRSPHGEAQLWQGSHTMTVSESDTQARAGALGQAQVRSGGAILRLDASQRAVLSPGQPPEGPHSLREELVANGDFRLGLDGWQRGNSIGFVEGQDVEGTVSLTTEDGSRAVRLLRRGSRGTHNESWLYQEIDHDISDFSQLGLSIRFKLRHQNLSGGGYEGSEYPLLLRVNFTTSAGPDFRVYGFYYQNTADNRTDNGHLVPADTWWDFTTSENLRSITPPPQQILSVQVSASGWDYESLVRRVSLEGG